MTIRAVVFDIGGVLVECEPMDFGPLSHLGERLAGVSAGLDRFSRWVKH